MAKTDYKNIDEYHKAFPSEVVKRMEKIRTIIKQIAPDATEVISYQIPAFKLGKYFLIYYSGYANHLSISSPWSEGLLKHFETDLKELKVSRAAIQFPLNKPLPEALIKKIVSFRKKEIPV